MKISVCLTSLLLLCASQVLAAETPAPPSTPTITPNRRIVVTVKPVLVDMAIVTEYTKDGKVKTTVNPVHQKKGAK